MIVALGLNNFGIGCFTDLAPRWPNASKNFAEATFETALHPRSFQRHLHSLLNVINNRQFDDRVKIMTYFSLCTLRLEPIVASTRPRAVAQLRSLRLDFWLLPRRHG
jgi:hypothetical protein